MINRAPGRLNKPHHADVQLSLITQRAVHASLQLPQPPASINLHGQVSFSIQYRLKGQGRNIPPWQNTLPCPGLVFRTGVKAEQLVSRAEPEQPGQQRHHADLAPDHLWPDEYQADEYQPHNDSQYPVNPAYIAHVDILA